jgi:hypothetical protein
MSPVATAPTAAAGLNPSLLTRSASARINIAGERQPVPADRLRCLRRILAKRTGAIRSGYEERSEAKAPTGPSLRYRYCRQNSTIASANTLAAGDIVRLLALQMANTSGSLTNSVIWIGTNVPAAASSLNASLGSNAHCRPKVATLLTKSIEFVTQDVIGLTG